MVNGIKNSTNDEHVGNLVVTQADVPHVFRLRKEEQKVIIHALMNSGNDFFYLQRCWVEFHDECIVVHLVFEREFFVRTFIFEMKIIVEILPQGKADESSFFSW